MLYVCVYLSLSIYIYIYTYGSPRFKARIAENIIKARAEGACQTSRLKAQ